MTVRRLAITHTTTYDYDDPVAYALQQVRLTPKSHASQKVLRWEMTVEGGRREFGFEDSHRNRVELVSFSGGLRRIVLHCEGEVEVSETHGVLGPHGGYMPLWMFERSTALTRPGNGTRRLAAGLSGIAEPLERLHALMAAIRGAVAYETGVTHVGWTAEDTLAAGHGVCQDMTHVFLACARLMGFPARYVSGYLMMDDRVEQEATHAWAEVHVPALGWVGFDVPNGISPDTRYVRVATGLDYADAAPVAGTRIGPSGGERLAVRVTVAQQQ